MQLNASAIAAFDDREDAEQLSNSIENADYETFIIEAPFYGKTTTLSYPAGVRKLQPGEFYDKDGQLCHDLVYRYSTELCEQDPTISYNDSVTAMRNVAKCLTTDKTSDR